MTYGKGAGELYDMRNDPGQFTNLAGDVKYADVLKKFRNRQSNTK